MTDDHEALVMTIAKALTEEGDEVTDGHRWDAERVLDALDAAGYVIS
jgi:hypothetical protein